MAMPSGSSLSDGGGNNTGDAGGTACSIPEPGELFDNQGLDPETAWELYKWQMGIGLEDPQISGTVAATVGLEQGALATSAGGATRFTPDGRNHHLFDPASGRSAGAVTSVSVTAPRATTADALSTALAVMMPSRARPLVASLDGVGARLTSTNGSVETLGAWPESV